MEISFTEDKMGFSVIMNSYGKDAIVSKIVDRKLTDLGLIIGMRIVEIDGVNVEGWRHKRILDKIQSQETRPFCIAFKKVKFCIVIVVIIYYKT